MSREVRRVPLDFAWPRGEVWEGYLRPAALGLPLCGDCEGSGASVEAQFLQDRWYGKVPFYPEERGSVPFTAQTPGVRALAERHVAHSPRFYGQDEASIVREAQRLADLFNGSWSHHLNQDDVDALVAAGRLMDFTHTCSREDGWQPKNPPVTPTAAEVNAWSLSGFGHDGINCWVVTAAELKRLGQSGTCPSCGGTGDVGTAEQRQAYEAWEPTDPPAGEGWQLWETVSEGSPVSPVFPVRAGLIGWLTKDYRQVGSERPMTRPQAEAFVTAGSSVGSFVVSGGEMHSGEAAVHELSGGGRP